MKVLFFSCCVAVAGIVSATGYLEDEFKNASVNCTGRPEILLIGDSILMGYRESVRDALKEVADVRWPNGNCANSQNVLIQLSQWKGLVSAPKVVQFNCGHWDVSHWDGDEGPITSLEEYGRNVRLIIRRLRRWYPGATIVFATTTPMNPNGTCGKNVRTTAEIRRYNEMAVTVVKEEGALVNDLFAVAERWPSSDYVDYCHYGIEARERLGRYVTKFLTGVLTLGVEK